MFNFSFSEFRLLFSPHIIQKMIRFPEKALVSDDLMKKKNKKKRTATCYILISLLMFQLLRAHLIHRLQWSFIRKIEHKKVTSRIVVFYLFFYNHECFFFNVFYFIGIVIISSVTHLLMCICLRDFLEYSILFSFLNMFFDRLVILMYFVCLK